MNFELIPKSGEGVSAAEDLPFEVDDIENSEEMREYLLRKHRLGPDATEDELYERIDAEHIAKQAVGLGLPENATHQEVMEEKKRLGVGSRGHLLALGLKIDATPAEIQEAEDREWANRLKVLHEVAEHMLANRARDVTPRNRISE